MDQNTAPVPMLDLAVEIFRREVGEPRTVEVLSGTKNCLFKVVSAEADTYVVKLYTRHADLIGGCELAVYRHLTGSRFVRRLVAGSPENGSTPGYLITEYRAGTTFLELVNDPQFDPAKLAQLGVEVARFVAECRAVTIAGFGSLDLDLRGAHPEWDAWLADYLDRAAVGLSSLGDSDAARLLGRAHDALRRFLDEEWAAFRSVTSALVPIDLNLSNFLITEEGRLLVLDLETFWGADPLLAFGEWAGHTYGTPWYESFARAWGHLPQRLRRLVRFYALLSNFDTFYYITSNALGTVESARPWGNRLRFSELIQIHITSLGYGPSALWPEDLLGWPLLASEGLSTKLEEGGGRRTVTPNETLDRLKGVQSMAGITRVADVTGLDATGIYIYQSIRPDAEEHDNTFTVFSGKGTTREQCQVSSIAEAIERFCAERRNYPPDRIKVASYEQLARDYRVLHPREFNIPDDVGFSEDETLEWLQAVDLSTGDEYYVTANAVFYPYVPLAGRALFGYFTTGLGAGNTYGESLAHGMAEVIERDAAALNRILRNNPAVPLETIDSPTARQVLVKLNTGYLNVVVRSITSPDLQVPVFFVICEDLERMDPMYISGGYGAHPNKEVALVHALNEAALSRAGTISGAREDLTKFRSAKGSLGYEDFKKKYAYWFDTRSRVVDYRTIPDAVLPTAIDDLCFMANAVRRAGFERQLVVDLSHEELRLRVVKILVPGIERYSFKMTCVGRRARAAYREIYGKALTVGRST
jgi:YcaO-like protein with predicted kinase domain